MTSSTPDLGSFYNEVEFDYEFIEANLRMRLSPSLFDLEDLNGKKYSQEPANFKFTTVGFPLPDNTLPEHKVEFYYEVLVERITYVVQEDGDRDEVARQKEVYYPDFSFSDFECDFTGATLCDEEYTEADTSLWPFTGPQPYEVGDPETVVPELLELSKAHVFDFTNSVNGSYSEGSPPSFSIKQDSGVKYWRLFTKNRGSYIPRQTRIDPSLYKRWADTHNSVPYEVYFRGIDTRWPDTPSNPERGVYPYSEVVQIKPDQRWALKIRLHMTFTLNANENGMGIDILNAPADAFSSNDYALDVYLPVKHPEGFDWKQYKIDLNANGEKANGIAVGDDRYNRFTDGPLTPVPPEFDPSNPDNY